MLIVSIRYYHDIIMLTVTIMITIYREIFEAENFCVCRCNQMLTKKLLRILKINFREFHA